VKFRQKDMWQVAQETTCGYGRTRNTHTRASSEAREVNTKEKDENMREKTRRK
jgi:hypothetical protein